MKIEIDLSYEEIIDAIPECVLHQYIPNLLKEKGAPIEGIFNPKLKEGWSVTWEKDFDNFGFVYIFNKESV